jgi:barstar (barnase inhibitor)
VNVYRRITKLEKNYLMVKCSNDFNLNIDGKKVQSERDAIEILANSFNINDLQDGNWDALFDRLQRSNYMHPERINIFLNNSNDLFIKDANSKNTFLEILSDTVSWWGEDVERYIVDGKRKTFYVYLLD